MTAYELNKYLQKTLGISLKQAKERKQQIAKGFAKGLFTKERHKKMWEEFEKLSELGIY
jgi:hypothetical protein